MSPTFLRSSLGFVTVPLPHVCTTGPICSVDFWRGNPAQDIERQPPTRNETGHDRSKRLRSIARAFGSLVELGCLNGTRFVVGRSRFLRAKSAKTHPQSSKTIPTIFPICSLDSGNEDKTPGDSPKNEPEESISVALRRSFFEACVDGPVGYVEALGEFIGKGIEAYKAGYSLQTLNLELNLAKNDPDALSYDLAQEESDMRTIWLSLIFLTCARCRVARPADAALVKDDHNLSTFVEMVIEAFRKGYDHHRLKLEQTLARSSSSPTSVEEQAKRDLEAAVLSQSMRIVMLTCELILPSPPPNPSPAP